MVFGGGICSISRCVRYADLGIEVALISLREFSGKERERQSFLALFPRPE